MGKLVGSYIWENFKLSIDVWERAEMWWTFLSLFVAALIAVAGIAGINYAVSPDLPRNGAVWLGAWLLVLILVVTPVRMWFRERALVNKVLAEATPVLALQFDPLAISGCRKKETDGKRWMTSVRVLVTANRRSTNCMGRMLKVYKWDNGKWGPSQLEESVAMNWANFGPAPLTIDPSAQQFLEVVYVIHSDNTVEFAGFNPPRSARAMFNSNDPFKIVMGVTDDKGITQEIPIRFQRGETPETFKAELCRD